MCRSWLIRQSCVTRITKHAEWPGLLCWCWEHRSEHPASLGGYDVERRSPVGYEKLTHKASAASSSHHAEVCDALLNPRFRHTATTEARSPDHARSDSFAHSSTHHCSPDRGRSDLCSRHQHRRAGRFCAFSSRPAHPSRGAVRGGRAARPDQLRIEKKTAGVYITFFTCVVQLLPALS